MATAETTRTKSESCRLLLRKIRRGSQDGHAHRLPLTPATDAGLWTAGCRGWGTKGAAFYTTKNGSAVRRDISPSRAESGRPQITWKSLNLKTHKHKAGTEMSALQKKQKQECPNDRQIGHIYPKGK